MSRTPGIKETKPRKTKGVPRKRVLTPRIARYDVGRPTLYQARHPDIVKNLCKLGGTDQEIADILGIHISQLIEWKHVHKEFADAFVVGKRAADNRVKRSLYQRAIGYEAEAVKVFLRTDDVNPVYAPYRLHIPGDVGAQAMWLKNRLPNEWRERNEHNVSGTVTLASLVTSAMDGRERPLPIARPSEALSGPVIDGEVIESERDAERESEESAAPDAAEPGADEGPDC